MISRASSSLSIRQDLERILTGTHHAPASFLGIHDDGDEVLVRVFLPSAHRVILHSAQDTELPLMPDVVAGMFLWRGSPLSLTAHPELGWYDSHGEQHRCYLPYTFDPIVPAAILNAFNNGTALNAYTLLGAQPQSIDGVNGVQFTTWAPNALGVSVLGDFNAWHDSQFAMQNLGSSGLWSLFIPELKSGTLYKFAVHTSAGTLLKADPYARAAEYRPNTASIVTARSSHIWRDSDWMRHRREINPLEQPLSVYEVHLGSWKCPDHKPLHYRQLAQDLVEHVISLGFTHIELLPIAEYPLDDSWGYQTTGYYAPTSRYGSPDDLRYFIDYCHQHGIGVLLDWTPAHFPGDEHGLGWFDGTHLYEHEDPQLRLHPDWGTLIFNYARNEVRSFLLSNAAYWLSEFHFDGLRVDAVASMLYLDYSRKAGEWSPNAFGGNENLAALKLLRDLNVDMHREYPGVLMIAEESTAWPMVSRPVYLGGLGFGMKWNLGWMHDTLRYFAEDPINRKFHHDRLTFSLLYAFHENFVLPLSHDEVVHGKGSLLNKMAGDTWQKLANLRLLYCYQYTQPGKKLLFMGSELASETEWRFNAQLPWKLLERPANLGVSLLLSDLNRVYREYSELHRFDFEPRGFEWLDCDDRENSVLAYLRKDNTGSILCLLNFTPVPRVGYTLHVPHSGAYEELLNSDASRYGGSNLGNLGKLHTQTQDGTCYLKLTLPPLAAILLRPPQPAHD